MSGRESGLLGEQQKPSGKPSKTIHIRSSAEWSSLLCDRKISFLIPIGVSLTGEAPYNLGAANFGNDKINYKKTAMCIERYVGVHRIINDIPEKRWRSR